MTTKTPEQVNGSKLQLKGLGVDRSLPTDFAYGGRAGHSRPSTAGAATAAQAQQLGVSGALQHSLYSGPHAADSGAQYSADAGLGSSLHEGWRNGAANPDRVSSSSASLNGAAAYEVCCAPGCIVPGCSREYSHRKHERGCGCITLLFSDLVLLVMLARRLVSWLLESDRCTLQSTDPATACNEHADEQRAGNVANFLRPPARAGVWGAESANRQGAPPAAVCRWA